MAWAAAIIVAVIAAGASAYAASEQAAAQEDAAKYNRKVAEQTAATQAETSRNAAAVAEDNQREHDRRILAQQRALVGGAGLTTEGSALLVMIDSAKQAELDAVRIRYGGEIQSTGFLNVGALEADRFQFQGRQARRTGDVKVGTTLLTGAANAVGAYYSAPRTPAPDYDSY